MNNDKMPKVIQWLIVLLAIGIVAFGFYISSQQESPFIHSVTDEQGRLIW